MLEEKNLKDKEMILSKLKEIQDSIKFDPKT